MPKPTILLISADVSLVQALGELFHSYPHLQYVSVADQDEALLRFEANNVVLLLMHLRRKSDGTEVRRFLQRLEVGERPLDVLLLPEPYLDTQAMGLRHIGVGNFLSRPFDLERITSLAKALAEETPPPRQRRLAPANACQVQSLAEKETFFYLPSTRMAQLMEEVERIAPQDTTILLTGETGTGKTRLARHIHELSPRCQEPFLVVNCGALSANLIESEMFGHVRGAFTSADRDRVGKFEAVGHGTLLLDEIDTLPIELQAKLLRVVDERVFEPVGSNKTVNLQARLMAASNRVITDEVAAGRFRADLLYRLNVVEFHLQPLRQKRDLIPFLANHFFRDFVTRSDRNVIGISDMAMQALQWYHWPGNIRQLRNVIERAVALCPGEEIQFEDLPETFRLPLTAKEKIVMAGFLPFPGGMPAATIGKACEDAEIARIRQALHRNNNNRLRAASELGISRVTLYKKLHRYGLMPRNERSLTAKPRS
jgi:DNA-binding NtrC family response regulator